MWTYAEKRRVTSDGIAVEGTCVLFSASGDGTIAGLVATIYEGQTPESGNFHFTLECPVAQHGQVSFDPPIVMDNGIYVNLDSNGKELILSFRHVHTNPGVWERLQEVEE